MKRSIGIMTLFFIVQALGAAESAPDVEKGRQPAPTATGKQMWAHSYLWAKAPDFVVEKWLTTKPEMEGKYLLIEYWATWCSACKRAQPLMNRLQEKFGDEMVIIGISDEAEDKVRPYMAEKEIKYSMAIDAQARMKDQLGIYGIPHVIIVEPGGYVIWEGFPLLKDYELTEETIEKILAVARKQKTASAK
jgi:cytochrome c biogenesis protein CcmG/thiol:disulfide interchange protein DsbE